MTSNIIIDKLPKSEEKKPIFIITKEKHKISHKAKFKTIKVLKENDPVNFSALQTFLINKNLKYPYKLEATDRLEKIDNCFIIKPSVKAKILARDKKSENEKHSTRLMIEEKNKKLYNQLLKKKCKIRKEKEKISKKQKRKIEINSQCKECMEKIQHHQFEHIFSSVKKIDQHLKKYNQKRVTYLFKKGQFETFPSLERVKRRIHYNAYDSIFQFGNDLRETFDYYFRLYASYPEIFIKCFKLSDFCDDMYNEMEKCIYNEKKEMEVNSDSVIEIDERDITSTVMNKYNRSFTGEQNLQSDFSTNKNVIKKKRLTIDKKEYLLNYIPKLTQKQTQDIINKVLPSLKEISKYEVDMDELDTTQQNNLYEYVKKCIESSKGIMMQNGTEIKVRYNIILIFRMILDIQKQLQLIHLLDILVLKDYIVIIVIRIF